MERRPSKLFLWNDEKNKYLKITRNVSFEDVIEAIQNGRLLNIVAHHNQIRYPHQQIFIVAVANYAYLVPYVEDETNVFLKTIIPSRKATRDYLT